MDSLKENTHWMLQYFDNSDKQLFIFLHPKMYRAEIYAWNKHHQHVKTVNAYDTWTDDTNVSQAFVYRYTTPYDAVLGGC